MRCWPLTPWDREEGITERTPDRECPSHLGFPEDDRGQADAAHGQWPRLIPSFSQLEEAHMEEPKITHLERRKIEAGVLIPMVQAFQHAFGDERATELAPARLIVPL